LRGVRNFPLNIIDPDTHIGGVLGLSLAHGP
jgi:hypothetical protein